jgi:hypothetical protein
MYSTVALAKRPNPVDLANYNSKNPKSKLYHRGNCSQFGIHQIAIGKLGQCVPKKSLKKPLFFEFLNFLNR